MNKLRVLVVALFVGIATYAQDVAHINGAELIAAMPETQKAEADLKKILEGHEAEVKKQTAELEKLQKEGQDYIKTLPQDVTKITDAMRTKVQQMQSDLQTKGQRLTEYQQTAAQEVSSTRQRLLEPIEKKAQDAINAVAARKGIKYVFDISQPGLVYYNGGVNVTQDVKKELGIN